MCEISSIKNQRRIVILIRPTSDWHTEMRASKIHKIPKMIDKDILPHLDTDKDTILVLAGDIGSLYYPKHLLLALEHVCPRFKHVLYVPGNHCHWGSSLETCVIDLYNLTKHIPNLIVDNFEKIPFNYLGDPRPNSLWMATLWTDYRNGNPVVMMACEEAMNDHKHIKGLGEHNATAEDFLGVHNCMREQLVEGIKFGDVVVTHHLPSYQSISVRYKNDEFNPAYASDMDHIIEDLKPCLMIHGHCVDAETEILTSEGWKTHETIKEGDIVYSYSEERGTFEHDKVKAIHIYPEYQGEVYKFKSKTIDFTVTSNHRLVAFSTTKSTFICEEAHNFLKRDNLNYIKAGNIGGVGLGFQPRMLELYCAIAADGNLCNTDLVRFSVKKERKIRYIKELLESLQIDYRIKPKNKNGMTSINFTLPEELNELNIKGLDLKLTKGNRVDCEEVLRAYSNTDGGINGNQIAIYTSKESEKDILQHLFIINGYACSVSSRIHGYSVKTSYTLYVRDKKAVSIQWVYNKKSLIKYKSNKELFWCISTQNGNFFMRRGGQVMLTGNSHESCDYNIGMTRIIGNPRGYYMQQNKQYDKELVIAI